MWNGFILLGALLNATLTLGASYLPERIPIKTRTESFSHQYYVAVREGRIWIRANPETKGLTEPGLRESYTDSWKLLHGDGLPRVEGAFWGLFGDHKPRAIVEISADGDNLIAISDEGIVYYAKFYDYIWTRDWGPPILNGPLKLPLGNISWAISHRGGVAGGFSDIVGNWHPISVGVTSLYALSGDGLFIKYADPWLPPKFGHDLCGPRRGRMKMISMSASASTLFVTDEAGNLFTRLADFDSVGDDPFLGWTYERILHDNDDPIVLPGEDWFLHDAVPGRITKNLTIFQNGKGNDARELRIEGVDASGVGGYFHKKIFERNWAFERTGMPVNGPFLKNSPGEIDSRETLGPKLDADYAGIFRIGEDGPEWKATVYGYNHRCSPAMLVLENGTERFQTILYTRRIKLKEDQRSGKARGTFETWSDGSAAASSIPMLDLYASGFARQRFVNVKLKLDGETLVIRHDPDFILNRSRFEMILKKK